jgi:hypothetical protein
MATYLVNEAGLAQPTAEQVNAYLALTEGASDETKARHPRPRFSGSPRTGPHGRGPTWRP